MNKEHKTSYPINKKKKNVQKMCKKKYKYFINK